MLRYRAVLGSCAAVAAVWLGVSCTAGNGGASIFGEEDEGTGSAQGGAAGGLNLTASGGSDGGSGGVPVNPCGSECGDEELCDTQGTAKDENCDGQVEEGCTCVTGTTHPCFKGDPSYLGSEGCFPGQQTCTELGIWGECTGGVHATEDCFMGTAVGCHPIDTRPFVEVDLMDGTGNQSIGGTTHTFNVTCPVGVNPCPTPAGTLYDPNQSGEYTVEYIKDGVSECTFPLFVGAPGLRVEMTWNWVGTDTHDLDLHLHMPGVMGDNFPWGGTSGGPYDCAWTNCKGYHYRGGFGVEWPNVMPAWTYDAVVNENNTCFFGPDGPSWANPAPGEEGCHNPRLDLDNINCDGGTPGSCLPENINVDVPPANLWFRVGVHHYSGTSYPALPDIKIFCDGGLAADIGTTGFAQPVQFPSNSSIFWLVADVLFFEADECGQSGCVVQPLYSNPPTNTLPLLSDESAVTGSFTPPFPPTP